eukprot:CAMPEP_0183297888 /NCGR_PEP_ID=MMETSP0160_2-20130417/5050_1 /TAXON_ID=2839 ORGANISM="Odontella Sinensis, Strain Grunow 1884" /NCGR_SAMPLE_ID=MMETSP0160_2 /ASSEMBLY_ACC=CAM_ASM_000250 /LENGTH=518 /DNA_ID=CAMNT_0025459785 /DNA_START=5 /DNA_END=1561 /DNA_ORIENTATION=+
MRTSWSTDPTVCYSGLLLICLSPSLGGLLFGYDIGATAFAISMITDASATAGSFATQRDIQTSWWTSLPLSHATEGVILSALCLGALLGSILVFPLADRLGRRAEIRIAASLYICGAALEVLSGTWLKYASQSVGVGCLFFGRSIFGVGVGFTMHGAPMYMAEMTPPSMRGSIVAANEIFIMLGVLLGYAAGYSVSGNNDHWFHMYAWGILVSCPMLLLTWYVPRSVRWLMLCSKPEEAFMSLQFLYRDSSKAELEFKAICCQMEHQLSLSKQGKSDRFILSASMKRALVIGLGLIAFQQVTGQPSIVSYATIIFQNAGFRGNSSVWLAIFMLCVTSASVAVVDKFGRKTLLYTGCSMMLVALVALSIAFCGYSLDADTNGQQQGKPDTRQFVILLSMFVYIGGFQVGYGPVSWLMLGEIFPLEFRGQAVALGVQMNFALNFLVQLAVPGIQDGLGLSNTFGMFGMFSVLSLIFIRTYVIETKGLSLEEIEQQLQLLTKQEKPLQPSETTPLIDAENV